MTLLELEVSKLTIEQGYQGRVSLCPEVVVQYIECLLQGDKFPPIKVFHDGNKFILADGFHRVAAYKRMGSATVAAEIVEGTERDATLHSVGANSKHGLPRTNADKKKSVSILLKDAEWSNWSDKEISTKCLVSDRFVAGVRKSLRMEHSEESSKQRKYINRYGNQSVMKVSSIGKKNPVMEAIDLDINLELIESDPRDDEILKLKKYCDQINAKNIFLEDSLSFFSTEELSEEGNEALKTITGLRNQIKTLETQLNSVRISVNEWMSQNAESMRLKNYWEKRCKRSEALLEKFGGAI